MTDINTLLKATKLEIKMLYLGDGLNEQSEDIGTITDKKFNTVETMIKAIDEKVADYCYDGNVDYSEDPVRGEGGLVFVNGIDVTEEVC